MNVTAFRRETTTGGRKATTRHIPPKLALAVGTPSVPAPEGWRWAPLTQLARMESGHTPSRRHPEYWGGAIPWIGIQDAKADHGRRIISTQEMTNELGIANSSARLLPANTVCLSRTASVGYVVVMGRPMATSQDFVNWVCSDDLDPEFLKYLFIAEGDDLLRFASGAVHPTIYFPEAKAFHICYPRRPEQRRIVDIVDEAFAGIATAKANAEKNLQNARALFESHLNAVFTRRGEGWVKKPLREYVEEISTGPFGSLLHKSDYEEGGTPLINPINIVEGTIIPDERKAVGITTARRLSRYSLRESDLVIGRRGEIGRCAVIEREQAGWLCGTGSFFVRPSAETNPYFLAHLLRSRRYRQQLEKVSGRATMPSISNADLARLTVYLPPLKRQEEVVLLLRRLDRETTDLTFMYQRKLAALDELKKSLLHQAFSGQL
jgi:type I restriction enzyme, S subunit